CPASFLFHAYHGVFAQTALQTAVCCSRQSFVLVQSGTGGGDATVVERWDGRAVQFFRHAYGAARILGVPLQSGSCIPFSCEMCVFFRSSDDSSTFVTTG
ncbi:unnamed protein product, partial [Ectocarpus sp. 13 AM-2016]